ncbi:ankyrin repeat domain-containing protein [Sphingomonas sp. OK281]|uniref:ankyrin repeat domain-containing protein n=1 Tax=Sphingomonas sp. OK281 TaxID=1881067 RepID=UPI0008EBFFAE|nr:ankyrin repeat domain-containing protein [Sphingomonas sp. OK281]SFO34423.1 Ankyrin repeat-containing protein [Sphingomonas sp. OK281]
MIDPLLETGADIDLYDDRGFTPLILAAYNGQAATVDALIATGANACRPDRDQGDSALMIVSLFNRVRQVDTAGRGCRSRDPGWRGSGNG